jgi:hypothetical protein
MLACSREHRRLLAPDVLPFGLLAGSVMSWRDSQCAVGCMTGCDPAQTGTSPESVRAPL